MTNEGQGPVVEKLTYTVSEYAAMLGKSIQTTVVYMEEGLIPGEKIKGRWMIRKPEVDEWFARQRVGIRGAA